MFNLFKKKEEVVHNWQFIVASLTENHKEKDSLYKCKECGEFKHKFEPVIKPREAQIE